MQISMPKESHNLQVPTSVPRLAMFNSMAGFGRCSTTIAIPVISAMQIQVCPIPTAVLSNHLAFSTCAHYDFTPHLREYIQAWKDLDVRFDGLYCGFLGNSQLIDIVKDFVSDFKPPVFLLDPVMGDNGRTYASITRSHCEGLKVLAGCATLLTPNLYEACLLTDTPYRNDFSEAKIDGILERLCEICPGDIIISGVEQGDNLVNYILQDHKKATYVASKAGAPHHGTGDLFASILISDVLHGRNLYSAVKKAADFISLCISGTQEANAPEIEGILFEKYLNRLMPD